MRSYPAIFFLIIFSLLCSSAFAQADDPVSVNSSIVRVNVGVVDDRGRPITSLQRGDFTVFEDGVKQDISNFRTTTAPFSVVILLDMSGSTKGFRQNIQLSATRFLDALNPDDRVAVGEFHKKVNLLLGFTANRSIAAPSIGVANGGGDTDLYKAIDFAIGKLSREKSPRKAIVVLTDGVDTDAREADRRTLSNLPDDQVPGAIKPELNETLARILDRADAQGVTIYPLALPTGDPARLADPTPRQIAMYKAARERLQMVARRTGGTLNAINRLEEMGKLYALVAADLRTLYTLEYEPANDRRDGKWRSIKVQVNNPDLISRSREGYYAK